jgi:hypothetical protein
MPKMILTSQKYVLHLIQWENNIARISLHLVGIVCDKETIRITGNDIVTFWGVSSRDL